LQALAATGDAPLPEPWSECRRASGNKSHAGRVYIAATKDGGQVSTGSRIDAMNASLHIEEHPDTSIEDALTFVIKERVALDYFEVVGTRVETALSRFLTHWLMSTQKVRVSGGMWWHKYPGFPPIGNHKHAVAFSAALVAAGKLGAPANDPLVAELYHETVGVHLEKRVAAKEMPGLVHTVVNLQQNKHVWAHGDLVATSEDQARKFSAALKSRGLLEARAGDPRVQSTARK